MLIDVDFIHMWKGKIANLVKHYVGPATLFRSGTPEVKVYLTGTNNLKTIEDTIKC